MSDFYFEYVASGQDKALILPNAERLDPSLDEQGSEVTAVNGEQERLYFHAQKKLSIRVRGIPDCEMQKWKRFIDATKCGTFILHTGGRLAWDGWDGAEVFRQRSPTPERDGCNAWAYNIELQMHETA